MPKPKLSHLSAEERRIISRLMTATLEAGYYIQLFDEADEVSARPSRTRSYLMDGMATTACTWFVVFADQHNDLTRLVRIGAIFLVHGNGEDVISDSHWPASKPEHEAILEGLMSYATGEAESLATA